MATILLFSLGTGSYQNTTYVHGGDAVETRFAALALRAFHDRLFPETPIDRALVFVTPEASKRNWQDGEEPGLASAWRHEPCPLVRLDLANPSGEAEFWELFEGIADAVSDGDRIVLDITHGFRTMQMVSLLAIAYLRSVRRDVEVAMVGYGQFTPGVTPTPYLDLMPMVSLLDWTWAVQQLRDHGDAAGLARLLASRQKEAFQTARAMGWAQPRLQSAALALQGLASGLRTLSFEEVTLSATKLQEALEALGEVDRHFARPFLQVKDAISDEVAALSIRSADHAMTDFPRHWATLDWLWTRQLYFPWLSLLNESLVSYVAVATGMGSLTDGSDAQLRAVHKYAAFIMTGAQPTGSGEEKPIRPWQGDESHFQKRLASLDQAAWRNRWREVPGSGQIAHLADRVAQLRNALMHAGFGVNAVAADSAGIIRKMSTFQREAAALPIWRMTAPGSATLTGQE